MATVEEIRREAQTLGTHLTALRHKIHEHPELGLELPKTQKAVVDALEGLGLEVHRGKKLSSVTAVLRGQQHDKSVLLRGDMDALPIQEDSGHNPRSKDDGKMHACGHDLHTSMLVGAAQLLSKHRSSLKGDVIFMFQPGEEGYDGAGLMLSEGLLEAAGNPVVAAYGIHVFSSRYKTGVFTTRAGTLLAACDRMVVTVKGPGGHGSAPHLGEDTIVAAATMVTTMQTMITRRFNAFDPVVATVGEFHGGTKYNILPTSVVFEATVRSCSVATRDKFRKLVTAMCQNVAATYGVEVDVDYIVQYPPTVNDRVETDKACTAVRDLFGADRLEVLDQPIAGSEDFSRVLEKVPGCYLFLGAATDEYTHQADNHSAAATFTDAVMPDGVALHALLAMRALDHAAKAN